MSQKYVSRFYLKPVLPVKDIGKMLLLGFALGMQTLTYAASPLVIEEQGSFMAGGTLVQQPGTFNEQQPMNPQGQTLHGDHAYVFYQKPVRAKHENSYCGLFWG